MSGPSRDDLIARALNALPPAEAEAVDAAMRTDRDARREYEDASAHLLLYEGVVGGPPPPPFAAVAARLDEPAASKPTVRGRLYRIAAAAVAAAAIVAVVLWSKETVPAHVRVSPEVAGVSRVERDGSAVAFGEARSGDGVVASSPTKLRVGDRARVAVDPSTRLRLVSDSEVSLEGGRAGFEVSHAPAAADGSVANGAPAVVFRVQTPDVTVEVRGTEFLLELFRGSDVSADAGAGGTPGGALLLVDVADGVVTANGVAVRAGERRLFVGSEPGSLESRSLAVSLEAADPAPKAGGPVDVRLVLENRSDVPAAVPARDAAGSPWFVEVTSPSGASVPYRITKDMLPDVDRAPSVVAPRGRVALTVRFAKAFPTPGAYRVRALFQPAGAAWSPVSQDLSLVVR